MELGEGLKIMKDFIDGGNHSSADSLEILEYMFEFLNFTHEDKREVNYKQIESSYKLGVRFVTKMREDHFYNGIK